MGRLKLDMLDVIDLNVVDLFMFLIEEIRFCTWKVRRLSYSYVVSWA